MKTNQPAFYFSSADEAEAAFYSAFEMGDIQLMDSVLADEGVSCIHPQSVPIIGRREVLDSWTQILNISSESVFHIQVMNRSGSDSLAVHLVAERIASDHTLEAEVSTVYSTNVYVRQKNGWRLLMHHASLTSELSQSSEEPAVTHQGPHTLQ